MYGNYGPGADPEPQDRGCTGDINGIAININISLQNSLVCQPVLVRVVARYDWKTLKAGMEKETLVSEATYLVKKRHYALRCQLSI